MATQVDKSLPPDITADITKVEPKTTFYKDGDQVAMTPEEAKKFQGGTAADPWSGLKASGWSMAKPIVSSEEAGSEIDSTQKKIDEYDTVKNNNTTAANIKLNAQEQAVYDENAKQLSTFDDDYNLVSDKLDSLVTAYDSAADTLVQTIKDTYAQRTKEMNLLNKSSLGAVTRGGIVSGRQRYASEINQGILTAEESAGINRIQKLANEEASLIAQAKMAQSEQDWKMFSQTRDALDKLNTKKVTLLKDQLDVMTTAEDRAEVRQTNALEKLKAIAEVGGDISPDLMSQIDSAYGEGFSTKYADVQALSKAQAAETDSVEFAQKVVNLLNDIPEGYEMPIGDAVYTGMKSPSDDLKVYMEKDRNGENKIITYNIKTGEVQSTGTGVFGKVTGSGDGSTLSVNYSGKFNEDELASRANLYVNDDGSIDWIALDDLENVDKILWNDMRIFLNKASSQLPDISLDEGVTNTKELVENKELFPGFAVPVPTKDAINLLDPTKNMAPVYSGTSNSTPQMTVPKDMSWLFE